VVARAALDRLTAAIFMRAEIIAVGSELLTPDRTDTNSLFITARLNEIGIEVRMKTIVGDDRTALRALVTEALGRSDLIITTGGLGPTDDDVTRDAVAETLRLGLELDEGILGRIRARFAARGARMPEINARQAQVPHGAVALENPNGTAPGLWIEREGRVLLLLPGPPREMQGMFEAVVRDRLQPLAGSRRVYRRVLRVTGRTESHTDEVVGPAYARWLEMPVPVSATILAALGQIELHLSTVAADRDAGDAALDVAVADAGTLLGRDLFSTDGRTLEQVVGDLLRAAKLRIAVAESCTGGLLASRLTDVPGSSDYVERGIVAYSNVAKSEWLDVPSALIAEHGAVSEPVAAAMARGIRDRARVDIGVGVTGIAGPGGGSDRKPVGTVVIAVARTAAPGDDGRVQTYRFPGNRMLVKTQASQMALDMVRRWLLETA
jgi:competence/damage-inducible protein CinA-like protein